MSVWKEQKIVDICRKVTSGGTPLKSQREYYENGTIPWLRTGEVKQGYIYETSEKITENGLQNSAAKLIPKNSIIIAMYGDGDTAGNVAITKIPLTTNQACCNLILNEDIAFYNYIYFYLKGSYNNLVNLKLGGSQQNLNAKSIKNFPVKIPPLPIQKKVAAILSAYDDLIENNNRRIGLLEKMAEEIYREWFVRMRFPGYEGVRVVKGVPEGWEVKKFKDFCLLQRGFDITRAEQHLGDIPIVSSSGITSFHNQSKAKGPGVITGRKGTLGKVHFINSDYWPHDTTLWVKDTKGNSLYLIYFLLKLVQLNKYDVGASNPTLNRNHLGSQNLVVPCQDLQKKFDAYIKPLFDQKTYLEQCTNLLQQIRDRLLSRLISGKLSVADLDIQFPPSMK